MAFRNFQPGSYTVLPLPEYQLQTARPVVEPSRPVYTPRIRWLSRCPPLRRIRPW
ncbi:MAG: hypothetical protein R2857_09925 [Vampirovibrionales bacterium]